jgi:hypothetical protein
MMAEIVVTSPSHLSPWVEAAVGPEDRSFEEYPAQSIEAWHKEQGRLVAGKAGRGK